MLKKLKRNVTALVTKPFRKKRRRPQQPYKSSPPHPTPSPPPEPHQNPPPPSPALMSPPVSQKSPFLFPKANSTVLPDPSAFFAPSLLSSPLPTNSFFQNFTLNNGDQPEYIHPYLIKPSDLSLSICYPTLFHSSAFLYQVFNANLTISVPCDSHGDTRKSHLITSFSDLSVTLDFPSMKFFLVRGSPYLTCSISNNSPVSISTIHAVISLVSNASLSKHTIKLNNGQIWLIYSSSPIKLILSDTSTLTSDPFSGILRIALLPDSSSATESILDAYSHCYPTSGHASFSKPFCMEYNWETKGWGDLLILAHPLHTKLLSVEDSNATILNDLSYKSIDGDLIAIAGNKWVLKVDTITATWQSSRGIKDEAHEEIISSLRSDVKNLPTSPLTIPSSYFYGKSIARAARLAMIAEEVSFSEAIPPIRAFLKANIEPWLEGTYSGNAFLYEDQWGGIITKRGESDKGEDFGFGVYNDHHYHIGYFLYAIAVLAKLDAKWGRKYRPQTYALIADFMTFGGKSNSNSKYTRLRCFDLYKMHSWAGGLTEFGDGRNQESTSEAVNAYYSAALIGLAYGDAHLVTMGTHLAAMEIEGAHMWWHVGEGEGLYTSDFTKQNRVVGVVWANKRDSGLWFAPADWKECRLGIQLLPISPICEVLLSKKGYLRELVEWAWPAMGREGVGEGWKGFVYALQGTYDREGALQGIRRLKDHDDGNSLSNLLWWVHSRGDQDDDEDEDDQARLSWFARYCH